MHKCNSLTERLCETASARADYTEKKVEKAFLGRHLRQARATPPAHNAGRLPHSCRRVQSVARCELTNTHTQQRTDERTNKHDGSQNLLAEVNI